MYTTARRMAFGFIVLTIGLIASVIVLILLISKGKKRIRDLPAVFESEASHLTWILVFFVGTYLARFASDLWIVPTLEK